MDKLGGERRRMGYEQDTYDVLVIETKRQKNILLTAAESVKTSLFGKEQPVMYDFICEYVEAYVEVE